MQSFHILEHPGQYTWKHVFPKRPDLFHLTSLLQPGCIVSSYFILYTEARSVKKLLSTGINSFSPPQLKMCSSFSELFQTDKNQTPTMWSTDSYNVIYNVSHCSISTVMWLQFGCLAIGMHLVTTSHSHTIIIFNLHREILISKSMGKPSGSCKLQSWDVVFNN